MQVDTLEKEMQQKREAYDAAMHFSSLSAEEQVETLRQESRMLRAAYGLRLAGAWVDGIMRSRVGAALHTMRIECQKINQTKNSFKATSPDQSRCICP